MKRELLNFFFTITGFCMSVASALLALAGKSFSGFLSGFFAEKVSDVSSFTQPWTNTGQIMDYGYSVPLSPI